MSDEDWINLENGTLSEPPVTANWTNVIPTGADEVLDLEAVGEYLFVLQRTKLEVYQNVLGEYSINYTYSIADEHFARMDISNNQIILIARQLDERDQQVFEYSFGMMPQARANIYIFDLPLHLQKELTKPLVSEKEAKAVELSSIVVQLGTILTEKINK